jgi:hypothetical protein
MEARAMTSELIHIDGARDGEHYSLTDGVKVMACKYNCGDSFIVSSRTRIAPHHLECGIQAAFECQSQLRNHQGPYYDHWLRAMAMWVARMRL